MFEYQRERQELQDAIIGQRVTKSCIKPKQQKVQLQLELSKDSHNFNPGQAQKLASKGTPKSQQDSGSSSRSMIESQMLVSSSALPSNPEKFAVAVVHEQSPGQFEIHLNPVQGILNLKQCYAYMDAPDKREQERKQDAANAASGKVAKPINVRFARQDPKRMKLAQAKSLTAQQRIKDDEPWCETEFFKAESSESRLEREKLLSDQQESNTSTILVDSPEAFLPVLCSMQLNQGDSENSTGPKSAQYISSLQFSEQVVARMRQANVISYSRLKKYLDPKKSDTDILNALQRAAVPIRGNWVVSSESLFTDNHVSSCGVKAEQLCKARNQIQKEACQVTGLPSRDVVDILSKIAVQRKRNSPDDTSAGWVFKLPVDQDFLQRYADEVSRLEKRFETKVKNVGRRAEEDEVKASAASPSKKGKAAPRQRKNSTKSRKDSYSSDH
ncbi:hypothetical protein B566_EDAN013502 [Ephemera danica]|nr:hypothetical protein B566_EDAN013502 [Ephemera danica]